MTPTQAVAKFVALYAKENGFKLPRGMKVTRRGDEFELSSARTKVRGSLAAPISLVGEFVARAAGVELAGRPLIVTGGFDLVLAGRRLLYDAAQPLVHPELVIHLLFHETLLQEDGIPLRDDWVRLAKAAPSPLDGHRSTHVAVLKKLAPWTQKSKLLDRVRGLYAIKTVLDDASYANELALEALLGRRLLKAAKSQHAAEREAANLGLHELLMQLSLGKLYREVEPYATALIDAGWNTHLALALRYEARLAMQDPAAEEDARALLSFRHRVGIFKSPGKAKQMIASARRNAAEALLTMAKGRDPSLRRLKRDIPKWSPSEREAFRAAARNLS